MRGAGSRRSTLPEVALTRARLRLARQGQLDASACGYDPRVLSTDFSRFMGELATLELSGFAAPRPVLDLDVVSRERREQLAVYRELLAPQRVSMFVTNVWRSHFGVFGYHFGRAARCHRFGASELARLQRLAPSLKLAQALLASQALPALHAADQAEGWADDWGLSTREREITLLAVRGLQNREIATLLSEEIELAPSVHEHASVLWLRLWHRVWSAWALTCKASPRTFAPTG